MIAALAGLVAQAALLLALTPLLVGCAAWVDAALGLGPAPAALQEYHDLVKRLRRPQADPPGLAPTFALASAVTAGLLLPTAIRQAPLAGSGDLLALVALLALARLAQALAGFASGDALPMLRSGRDLVLTTLSEPILLLAMLVIAAQNHTVGLPAMAALDAGPPGPGRLLAFVAALGVALLEGRRVADTRPVPGATPLRTELITAGGPDLAVLRLAAMVRHLVILSALACVFLPWGLANPSSAPIAALVLGGALYAAKMLLLALVLRALDLAPRHPISSGAILAGSLGCALLGLVAGGVFHA